MCFVREEAASENLGYVFMSWVLMVLSATLNAKTFLLQSLKRSKACVEITCAEFTVGVYLGKGFTNKEISRITGLSINAVRNHAHWLKKKIGYKSMNDLTVLNQRYDLLDIRSWNLGCKN